MLPSAWSDIPDWVRGGWRELASFAIVGGAATLAYAAVALVLTGAAGFSPLFASAAAYLLASILSYYGHRHWTFLSDRPHGSALGRFAGLTLAGFLLAVLLPGVFESIGASLDWAIVATAAAIPAINFVVLKAVVFGRPDFGRR